MPREQLYRHLQYCDCYYNSYMGSSKKQNITKRNRQNQSKAKYDQIYQNSDSLSHANSQQYSSMNQSSFSRNSPQAVLTENDIQKPKPSCQSCPSFRWQEKKHPSYHKIRNSKNKNFIKHFMLKLITQGFTKQQINKFFEDKWEDSGLIDVIKRCVKEHKKKYRTQKVKGNWNNNLQAVKNFFLIKKNLISEPDEKIKKLARSTEQSNQSGQEKNSCQKKDQNSQQFVGNLNPLNLIDQKEHKLYNETMRKYADRSIREVMIPSAVENHQLLGIKKQTIYSLLFQMHRTRNEELMLHSKIINPQ